MLLTYVDESYCRDCYYVAALLCPDTEALSLTSALDAVVSRAATDFEGVSADAELHGHDILHGKNDWQRVATLTRARIRVYNNAFQAIADHRVRVIIRGVRSERLRERYGDSAHHPHAVALTHLLERVDEYAARTDDLALVIADDPGQDDQRPEYRSDLVRYRQRGTGGYRSRRITNIVDTLHFAPSSASRLLQAADLIAFLYHRMRTQRADTDERAVRANRAIRNRLVPRVEHASCWRP